MQNQTSWRISAENFSPYAPALKSTSLLNRLTPKMMSSKIPMKRPPLYRSGTMKDTSRTLSYRTSLQEIRKGAFWATFRTSSMMICSTNNTSRHIIKRHISNILGGSTLTTIELNKRNLRELMMSKTKNII